MSRRINGTDDDDNGAGDGGDDDAGTADNAADAFRAEAAAAKAAAKVPEWIHRAGGIIAIAADQIAGGDGSSARETAAGLIDIIPTDASPLLCASLDILAGADRHALLNAAEGRGDHARAAALAGAGAILGKFNSTMAQGERLGQLSAITGESVSSLVELRHALSAAGLSGDSVSTIFARFAKAIDDAKNPSSEAAKAFAQLGLDASKLGSLTATEQVKTLQKAIASLPTASERAAAVAPRIYFHFAHDCETDLPRSPSSFSPCVHSDEPTQAKERYLARVERPRAKSCATGRHRGRVEVRGNEAKEAFPFAGTAGAAVSETARRETALRESTRRAPALV